MGREIKSKVKLSDVHFDEELYPRSHYHWQTGYDYSQSMRCGAVFPPIVLALLNGKNYLVDGKHRFEANKLLKNEEIDAIIHTGWNKKKIFTESIRLNITHGKVLSPYEKRKIAVKLMEMDVDNKEVCELVQIPEDKLEKFIGDRLINTLTGEEFDSDGNAELAREIGKSILKSGIKHFAGQTLDSDRLQEIESSQKDFYMSSQVTLLRHTVNILEGGLLNEDNKNVMKLISKLKELLEKY